jgi:hypothetical protein
MSLMLAAVRALMRALSCLEVEEGTGSMGHAEMHTPEATVNKVLSAAGVQAVL